MPKKVCVIGAGPSGLVTIKELINKNHDVKCFEANTGIGGSFRSVEAGGRSYDSLKLTVSNYFMAYSDFMPEGQERTYWTVAEYRQYMARYAKHFNINKHIYLSHMVTSACIKNNKIHVQIKTDNEVFEEVFDHIVICSGSNYTPKYPKLDDRSNFEGQIIHSSEYVNAKEFREKDVVCIGLGESGADTVHEVSEQANSCNVLVKDYPNVIPRWIKGYTNDAYTSHSLYGLKKKGLDKYMNLKSKFYLKYDKKMSKTDYIVQTWIRDRESFMGKFITKSDDFIQNIINGKIKLTKGKLDKLTKNGVITNNGLEIKADVVLLNTGYKTDFDQYEFGSDFLNPRKLFKQMIHPDHGDLVSIIGWARPTQGGLPACSEMQARYISLLISEEKKPPSKNELQKTIESDARFYEDFFNDSKYIKSLICYHEFMTGMGKIIGCSPKLFYLTDLSFSKKMIFGSHIPSFYRLPSSQARKTIDFLPIAYSKRRSWTIVLLILCYNPLFFFNLFK